MEKNYSALKKTARHAGLAYLAFICAGLYAHVYVPLQIFVRGDATATAKNILAHEVLFRTCVAVSLAEGLLLLYLSVVLYRLLSKVNQLVARGMVILAAVQVPIVFVLAVFKLGALMIAKGALVNTFAPGQLPDLAMLLLKLNENGMMVLELLSGLWLLGLGRLVYPSRFMPKALGVLLFMTAVGYCLASLTFLLAPAYQGQTQLLAFICWGVGEGIAMLWLLMRGVKDHLSITIVAEVDYRLHGKPVV